MKGINRKFKISGKVPYTQEHREATRVRKETDNVKAKEVNSNTTHGV